MGTMPALPEDVPPKDSRSTKWFTFFMLLGFSTVEIYLLLFGKLEFVKWKDWIILGGAVFFPVLTIIAGLDLVKDWSTQETDRITTRTFGWLIGAPIAALVGLWGMTSLFGWFNDIPSWAAVIIVLLIILIIRR
jgi:hypothetical protein